MGDLSSCDLPDIRNEIKKDAMMVGGSSLECV